MWWMTIRFVFDIALLNFLSSNEVCKVTDLLFIIYIIIITIERRDDLL